MPNGVVNFPETIFNYPIDLFEDANGNIYVLEYYGNKIKKFVNGSNIATTIIDFGISGSSPTQVNQPINIFVDAEENIYVCDRGNNRIQKWAKNATTGVTVAGGNGLGNNANQLNRPSDLYVDDLGNIYVCDNNNYRVQKWQPNTSSGVTIAGTGVAGNTNDKFNYPVAITFDTLGNLYVADVLNARVQKWRPNSTVGVTLAGVWLGNPGNTDSVRVNNPADIEIGLDNELYISENYGNNPRIQKWLNGATSGVTVAGYIGRGSNLNQFYTSTNIFVNKRGELFALDGFQKNRILKFGNPSTPIANPVTITAQIPSGQSAATITSNFSITIPEGGDIANIKIISFPTGAASLTIGATTYTAPNAGGKIAAPLVEFPANGVLVPTDATGVPLEAISVTPSNTTGASTVVITYIAVNAAGNESLVPATLTLNFSGPLPLTLVTFTGIKTASTTSQLKWTTSNEKDFELFEVQKSADAKSFEAIGKVYANETIGTYQKSYGFIDNNATSLKNYYRLKMIDADGSFSYSKIINIKNEGTGSIVGEFYPNPIAGGYASIDITTSQAGTWQSTIISTDGKIINRESHNLIKGHNSLKLSFQKTPKGEQIILLENRAEK